MQRDYHHQGPGLLKAFSDYRCENRLHLELLPEHEREFVQEFEIIKDNHLMNPVL